MTDYGTILYDVSDDAVATITLNSTEGKPNQTPR